MMGTLIRNEKRAASSRRRPRKSPSVIVAPERETPGTSAAACASPIPIASENLSLSAPRVLLPTASPTMNSTPTSTRLKTTTQGLRTDVSKKSSRKNPIRAAGMVEANEIRQPLVRIGEVPPAGRERARKRPGHSKQITPEKGDHGNERAEVQRDVEGKPEAVLVQPQEVLPEKQVPRAGDGQELREPLHHAEQYSLQDLKHFSTPPSGRLVSTLHPYATPLTGFVCPHASGLVRPARVSAQSS